MIYCPYYAKTLEQVETKPGCWKSARIGIFKTDFSNPSADLQIGEYLRNFSSFGEDTFFPFQKDGRWLALYSKKYTATRVMSLPDCTDLGGEEESAGGFCPTAFYVPQYCVQCSTSDNPDPSNSPPSREPYRVQKDGEKYPDWPGYVESAEFKDYQKRSKEWDNTHPFIEKYAHFGFVSGCVWGDDTSWKLEYLDLSQADKGIITRDDRFGYVELLGPLKDSVCVYNVDAEIDGVMVGRIRVAEMVNFSNDGTKSK